MKISTLFFIFILFLSIKITAESEPNNNYQQANPLTINSSDSGTLFLLMDKNTTTKIGVI